MSRSESGSTGVREAFGPSFDPLDGRVEHLRPGAAADILVVRVQVADSESGKRQHGRLPRPRGDERDLPRPRQKPVGYLESGVALADDHDPLPVVVGRSARVDVVARRLRAGQVGPPRRGDAEGEDRGLAAVLAVGRRQDEPVSLALRLFNRTVVADCDPRPLDVRAKPRLHLLARGEVEGSVHESRHGPAVLRLVAEKRVVVVPLVLAGLTFDRRPWLGPADQALEHRKSAEHPARRVIAGEDGESRDSGPGEAVGALQTARAASDDDDVVGARRKRALYRSHRFAVRRRRASACSMRNMTWGCSSRNGSSSGPGTVRQRSRLAATTSAGGASPGNAPISPKKAPPARGAPPPPSITTRASPSTTMNRPPPLIPCRRTRCPSANISSPTVCATSSS